MERKRRRTTWASAVVACCALLATACGNGDGSGEQQSGPTTITFANWADAEQTTRGTFQEIVKKFEAANPDIKVKSEAIAFSDMTQQLVLRNRSGNPPDVAQLSANDTFSVAATKALAPLDDRASSELKSSINPTDLENGSYQGKLVAFPWLDSPQGFWYNKKLMAQAGLDPNKPPATIAELNTSLAAIKAKFPKVTPLGLDTTNRAFGLAANWSWMKTFGAEPFSEGKANADTEEMKAYLTWMRELGQKGYIAPGKKIGDFRPLAAQDQVAFIWDQNVLQGVIQGANKMTDQQFYQTWGVAPLPKGTSGQSFTVNLGHQLVMFNKSKKKEAAWKFIEYLATSEDAILGYTLDVGAGFPPLAKPEGKIAGQLDTPVMKAYTENIVPTSTRPPYGPDYAKAYSPIMAGVQQAVTSTADIGEITKSIQSQLESVLR